MPVALLLFLPLLTSLGNGLVKGADNAAQGKYNKALVWLLAGFGVYLLISGWSKSKQQSYLNTAGTDKATQQAQALRDAFNKSGIGWLMQFDTTDTDLVFQVATEITDYAAVSDSYRVLYSSELTTDLQTELSRTDLQKFWDTIYKRGTNPTTPTVTGKQVKAKQTVNLRVYAKPTVVEKQAKAGETIGTYVGEEYLTITGTRQLYVVVEVPALFGLYTLKYYVQKVSVTIV